MGQEQSYAQASLERRRYYDESVAYRKREDKDYKRHKARRSADSFKSDHTDSSGYRSASSGYECRSDSAKSDYYCTSLYKNDHYKDINKEIYKPVKITKEQRYQLQLYEEENLKSERLKSYLSDTEKKVQKKAGIRNYTPKILSEDDKIENWI